MARYVANVDITTETFGTWVERTNLMLDSLATEIITANTTYANTGAPGAQRNARLYGSFTANTLVAETALRGGNTGSSSNLNITSNAIFTSNVSISGTVTIKTDHAVDVYSNTNLGATVGSPLEIYSFTKASYKAGKFMVKAANTGGTTQMADMVIAHDGTTPYITVYGVVPSDAPIGDFSVDANTTHIRLKMSQTEASCKTVVVANLIK